MPPRMPYTARKAKDTKGTLLRTVKMLKPFRVSIIIIMLAVTISTVFSILAPVFMYQYFSAEYIAKMFNVNLLTYKIESINTKEFLEPFIVIGSSYIIAASFSFIAEFSTAKLSGSVTYSLRKQTKEKIDKLPLSFFDKTTNGDLLSRVTNDIDTISSSLQQIINQLFKGVFQLIGVTIAMFVIDWRLALIAFATLPVSIVIALFIAMKSQKLFVVQQRTLGQLNGQVEEVYGGFKVIKLFSKEKDVNEKFVNKSAELCNAGQKATFFTGMIQPFLTLIHNIGYVFICVVGGILKAANSIVTFFVFLNLFQQPIQQIAQITNVIQQTAAASERVFEILDAKEEIPDCVDALDASNIEGKVDFDNVDFSYTPEVPLIENLNLHINPGESIAIVGPTGAGKTTLVNLIMRFYEITGGQLLIDSKPIDSYNRASMRKSIGMVLQDTWLFNGTIADNIAYGRPEATREEIIEAAKEAHAHHFIELLPQGYDTILNEEASNISQGQRQLITIARAILSNPRIMILDEATSSVDTRTEKALQDAMNNIMKERTSFVIAHRLSTIKNAKIIIVMNHGHIVEQGNHKELLEKGGFYADLYNAQFMGNKLN
ncbi:aBC transporter related protein [Clostridium sp. CAG:288]|nr:aBC transporter related protein [Clostridium sp. CAG:288]